MEKVLVIVTGPERNGTTYLSKLICSIPNIYCGFETGLLLDNDFKKCEPFCKWIYHGREQWGLSKEINLFDNNLSFDDKYKLLFENKGSYNKINLHQKLIFNSKYIVDKTPAYFRNLEFVRKNSNNIPIIISIKYLKDYYISLCVKRNSSFEEFKNLYLKNLETLEWIKNEKPNNIFLFLYDDIINDNFNGKLKKILNNKIYLTDVDINFENFKKKIEGHNFVYKNWDKNENNKYKNIDIPIDKEVIEKYNSLINELNCYSNL